VTFGSRISVGKRPDFSHRQARRTSACWRSFESHEVRWLKEHAVRRGYGKKRSSFLADGSDHIWRFQKTYFPDAAPCIDWYHIIEKLWVYVFSTF
jgi:hypothetical protein